MQETRRPAKGLWPDSPALGATLLTRDRALASARLRRGNVEVI